MSISIQTEPATVEITPCPYCGQKTSVALPADYEPVFVFCMICRKKFIVERLSKGFQALKTEEAPCTSDPDWRAIEYGGADEM